MNDKICEYGCNQPATHQFKNKKWCCQSNHSKCPSIKKNKFIDRKGYDYNLLPQEVKDRMNWNKGNYSSTQFIYNGTGNHKAALIQERGHQCEDCQHTEWKDKPIPLELEHTDGDNKNNTRENLKLLCCNCHALTPTWRGRNINSGKAKVSDIDLLTAYEECSNIRQTLLKVGLAAKGGNYKRLKKLIAPMVKLVDTRDLDKI